jgi:hypothetical protein
MKVVSKMVLALVSFMVFSGLTYASSADVTFSGIVGGDIRAIYSTFQSAEYSEESGLVWMNGDSIEVNTYAVGNAAVREVVL